MFYLNRLKIARDSTIYIQVVSTHAKHWFCLNYLLFTQQLSTHYQLFTIMNLQTFSPPNIKTLFHIAVHTQYSNFQWRANLMYLPTMQAIFLSRNNLMLASGENPLNIYKQNNCASSYKTRDFINWKFGTLRV